MTTRVEATARYARWKLFGPPDGTKRVSTSGLSQTLEPLAFASERTVWCLSTGYGDILLDVLSKNPIFFYFSQLSCANIADRFFWTTNKDESASHQKRQITRGQDQATFKIRTTIWSVVKTTGIAPEGRSPGALSRKQETKKGQSRFTDRAEVTKVCSGKVLPPVRRRPHREGRCIPFPCVTRVKLRTEQCISCDVGSLSLPGMRPICACREQI